MKLIPFYVILLLFAAANQTIAQRKDPIQFQEMTFDFGTIKEEAGPVSHTYTFSNQSERPIKILSVQPSCGCTTPDWSKEPIPPGSNGFIIAKYDPASRPGFFYKTLTVTTDYDGGSIVLYLKGTVVMPGDFTTYREQNGNWKLVSTSFNMGKVWLKDEYSWKNFEIVNGGTQPITVSNPATAPNHIKIEVTPVTLKPNEKGIIRIGYNGKKKDAYGFQNDNIVIHTNDLSVPDKSFTVYATTEEFFPVLTPEEQSKAPRLQLPVTAIDFGTINADAIVEKTISIVNNGRKELIIRSVQPNCQCIKATVDKPALQPGKSTEIHITFDSSQRKATQQKLITIYSNDPVNPVQRISVAAYISK